MASRKHIFLLGDQFQSNSPFDNWMESREQQWQTNRSNRKNQKALAKKNQEGDEDEDEFKSFVRVEPDQEGIWEIKITQHILVITKSENGKNMPHYSKRYWEKVPKAFVDMDFPKLKASVKFDITIHFEEEITDELQVKINEGRPLVAYYRPDSKEFGPAVYYADQKIAAFKAKFKFDRGEHHVHEYNLASEVEHHMGFLDQYYYDKVNDEYVIVDGYINTMQGTANVATQEIELRKIAAALVNENLVKRRIKKNGFFESKVGDTRVVFDDKPGNTFPGGVLKDAPDEQYPTYELDHSGSYRILKGRYGGRGDDKITPLVKKL
ncbi:MAG: hypothetical protein ACPGJS_09335 [Flammeovirgaceae bacterium]